MSTNCFGCMNENKLCVARDHYVCMYSGAYVKFEGKITNCKAKMDMKLTIMINEM
jgi:hypothetical protein